MISQYPPSTLSPSIIATPADVPIRLAPALIKACASFGLTNCAERTAIFKAVSEGHRDFEMIVVYGDTEQPISPCGACRQVMAEFFKQDSKVILIAEDKSTVVMTVGELLPYSFTDLQ